MQLLSHTHTHTWCHWGIHANMVLNIWWHLENQLVKVNKFSIMHWGERNLMLNTNRRHSNANTHTCDGVWVEVPGLFCHVEDSWDKCFHPGWQFAEKSNRKKEESQSESGRVGEREIIEGDSEIPSGFCAIYSQITCRRPSPQRSFVWLIPNYTCGDELLL